MRFFTDRDAVHPNARGRAVIATHFADVIASMPEETLRDRVADQIEAIARRVRSGLPGGPAIQIYVDGQNDGIPPTAEGAQADLDRFVANCEAAGLDVRVLDPSDPPRVEPDDIAVTKAMIVAGGRVVEEWQEILDADSLAERVYRDMACEARNEGTSS